MSANVGRKKVDPNETTSQKLSRIAGSRVSALRNRIAMVGSLGPLIHQYARENHTDPSAVVNQIISVLSEDFKSCAEALQTGKSPETAFKLNL